jgi:hypothetical protein
MEERLAAAEKAAQAARRRPERRRRRLSDKHLEKVARVYRKALEAGNAPTRAVAIEFFGINAWRLGYSSAKRWVQQARKAGHLRPTAPGRKGA